MIHRVYSPTLRSFKTLELRPHLNILLADRTPQSHDRQTRNGAGKTSLAELIHFLLGLRGDPKSIFVNDPLREHVFAMEFDFAGNRTLVERSGAKPNDVFLTVEGRRRRVSNDEWSRELSDRLFGLPEAGEEPAPTGRQLLTYFARRQALQGFADPFQQNKHQSVGETQMCVAWLLGLDWRISAELEHLRARQRELAVLKRALRAEGVRDVVGEAARLHTAVTLVEERLRRLRASVGSFRVAENYRDLEAEAATLAKEREALSNANVVDERAIQDLDASLAAERPPLDVELERLFGEAQVVLPEAVRHRFDEVHQFHEAVVKNRRSYLDTERRGLASRIEQRRRRLDAVDARLSEVMAVLKSTGALDQLLGLQQELSREEAKTGGMRERLQMAQRLESGKEQLRGRMLELEHRLRLDLSEREALVRRAIVAFGDASAAIYERPGELRIDVGPGGLRFDVAIHAERSTGIKSMQTFCFDLLCARFAVERHQGPGFLVHDSHLFDSVDERQISNALWLGARDAARYGFQYLVTLNSERLPPSSHEGFRPGDHVLPVKLSDAGEDGGLFGLRFE